MIYKTIVVHVDNGPRRAERLALAFTLAQRFEAHLVGLFALEVARIPSYAQKRRGRPKPNSARPSAEPARARNGGCQRTTPALRCSSARAMPTS